MNPVLLALGPIQVRWYGLLIVSGAVLAAWLATRAARRRHEDPEHVWNVLLWVLVLGIIGARLYHVFSTPTGDFVGWPYYRQHPLEIIAFWHGGFRGLGIYGAVIGGFVAVALYSYRHHLKLLQWLDILAPGLLLAQAVGRMGNRINQELYGPPASLPWAFHINPAYPCQEPAGSPGACGVPAQLTDAAATWYATHGFHPTFYYEALWNVLGFGLLFFIARRGWRWLRTGDVFFLYLIWYPLGRFWVEMFRPDAWRMGSLATAQWFALAGMATGAVALLINHRRPRRPGEERGGAAAYPEGSSSVEG
jgi:phosphatidylglycerol---prolipoprotein diacylglyceryl transferase